MWFLNVVIVYLVFVLSRERIVHSARCKGKEWFENKKGRSALNFEEMLEEKEDKLIVLIFMLLPASVPFIILGAVNFFIWNLVPLLIMFLISFTSLFIFLIILVFYKEKRKKIIAFVDYVRYPNRFPYQPDMELFVLVFVEGPIKSILAIVVCALLS